MLPGDPYSAPAPARPFLQEVGADPGRLRIGLLPAPPQSDLSADPDCREAVEATGRLLESLGHSVEVASPAELGSDQFSRHFGRTVGADVALMVQQFEKDLGRQVADDELEPRNAAYRGMGRAMPVTSYLESRAWLGVFSRKVAAWWASPEQGGEGFDVLVTPVLGTPPPPLGWLDADGDLAVSAQRVRALMPYTAQFNVTGQPAVSLPLHTTADGLPVGVQLVGAYGREDLLLRLASQLEQAAPWADRWPQLD